MRLDIEYTDEGVCDEREEAAVQSRLAGHCWNHINSGQPATCNY
jgi:hypothetical protein